MASFKVAVIFISVHFLLTSYSVSAEKLIFDLDSDHTEKWFDINCLYSDDYADFEHFGSPVTLPKEDDIYPEKRGFWTPGRAQSCDMQYFGGVHTPMAKSIKVGMYLSGKPQILVTGKFSPLDEGYTTEIGSISEEDGTRWFETTIDLQETKTILALNFTLISIGDDILLVDKIEIELEDPPTTVRPIVNEVVTLDTENDYWILWEQNCHYMDDFTDLWVYGCPQAHPKEDDVKTGYWSPCSTSTAHVPSCSLTLTANSTVLRKSPQFLRIRSYVDGEARINVTVRSSRSQQCEQGCSILGVITGTEDKWSEIEIPVNASLSGVGYAINIELIPNESSTIILEKIELSLIPQIQETTTPESAAGIAIMGWHMTLLGLLLLTVSSLHLQ